MATLLPFLLYAYLGWIAVSSSTPVGWSDTVTGDTIADRMEKTDVQRRAHADLIHSHLHVSTSLFRVGSGAGPPLQSTAPNHAASNDISTRNPPKGFLAIRDDNVGHPVVSSTTNVEHPEDAATLPSPIYPQKFLGRVLTDTDDALTLSDRFQLAASWLTSWLPLPSTSRDVVGHSVIICSALYFAVCFMQNQDRFNVRMPPYYDPDDRSTSFRAYVTDLMHWVMMTDLAPHQQATAIISRLGGTARDMGRTLSPDELFNGGNVNGEHLDPVTYIISGLHRNFAQLDEETRLAAMTEFLAFARRQGESISSVLARYELVRNRARNEGNFDMNVEGNALQLLRATHTSETHMIEFLRPFGGRLPATEVELQQLMTTMRRTYRITEHAPNNLGQHLHGNRQAPQNAYPVYYNAGDSQARAPTTQPYLFGAQPQQPPPTPAGGSYYNNANAPDYMAYNATAMSGTESSGLESGTDSDTSSDDPNDPIDFQDIQEMPPEEAEEYLYFQKSYHKKRWRRFTQKPVRKVRRTIKKHAYFGRKSKGKGKGKGYSNRARGPQRTLFFVEPEEQVEALAYLSSKGKGGNTSGKGGFGRKGNPIGRDGKQMECFECGSTEHLAEKCPNKNSSHFVGRGKGRRRKGKGRGSSSSHSHSHYTQPALPAPPEAVADSNAALVPAFAAPTWFSSNDYHAGTQHNATGTEAQVDNDSGPLARLLQTQSADPIMDSGTSYMLTQEETGPIASFDPWANAPRQPALAQPQPLSGQEAWTTWRPLFNPLGRPANTDLLLGSTQPPPQGLLQSNNSTPPMDWNLVPGQGVGFPAGGELESASRDAVPGSQLVNQLPHFPTQATSFGPAPTSAAAELRARADNERVVNNLGNILNSLNDGPSRQQPPTRSFADTQVPPVRERERLLLSPERIFAGRQPSRMHPNDYNDLENRPPSSRHTPIGSERSMTSKGKGKGKWEHHVRRQRMTVENLQAMLYRPNENITTATDRGFVPGDTGTRRAGNQLPLLATNPMMGSPYPYTSVFGTSHMSTPLNHDSPDMVMTTMSTIQRVNQARSRTLTRDREYLVERTRGENRPGHVRYLNNTFERGILVDTGAVTNLMGSGLNFPVPDDDELNSASSDSRGPPPLVSAQHTPRPSSQDLRETQAMSVSVYQGDSTECSICQQAFFGGEIVCRLPCLHVFHRSCIVGVQARHGNCPNCRGSCNVVAAWAHPVSTPAPSPRVLGPTSSTVEDASDELMPFAVEETSASRDAVFPSQPFVPTNQSMSASATQITAQAVHVTFGTTQFVSENLTPRSAPTETTIESDIDSQLSCYPLMPLTYQDAEDWSKTPVGTILEAENKWTTPQVADMTQSFHLATRPEDPEMQGLLVDPGSVGNLGGNKWALTIGRQAMNHGRQPREVRRDRPLRVSGVGYGAPEATHNVVLPTCLKRLEGDLVSGTFETPIVGGNNEGEDSELPGLLGLMSLTNRRGVLDFVNKQLHFLGPGDFDLKTALPPGTESFQLITAPSGHLILPCTHYAEFDEKQKHGNLTLDPSTVSLMTQTHAPSGSSSASAVLPPAPGPPCASCHTPMTAADVQVCHICQHTVCPRCIGTYQFPAVAGQAQAIGQNMCYSCAVDHQLRTTGHFNPTYWHRQDLQWHNAI